MEEDKKNTTKDLLIILGVCILPAIFVSTYYFLDDSYSPGNSAKRAFGLFYTLLQEVLSIFLVAYVLNVRGKNLSDLGIHFRWKELLNGVLLTVAAYMAYYISWLLIVYCVPDYRNYYPNAKHVQHNFSIVLLLFLIINPLFEELIVRGFLMSKLKVLTKSPALIVLISVVIQSSYHLYQGVMAMFTLSLIFLVFAIYYRRSGNLTPVIIAHLIFDLATLLR